MQYAAVTIIQDRAIDLLIGKTVKFINFSEPAEIVVDATIDKTKKGYDLIYGSFFNGYQADAQTLNQKILTIRDNVFNE